MRTALSHAKLCTKQSARVQAVHVGNCRRFVNSSPALKGVVFMRKHHVILCLACLLAGCLLLSGCGDHWRPHSRREVLQFVQEKFPGEDVTVAKSFTNPTLENGKPSPDRIWACWFTDLPGVVFHVESRRYTGGPVPMIDYSLYHDRDHVFWSYYLEQYQDGVGSFSLWNAAAYGNPEFSFSSMADVSQAAEQLRAFYRWYQSQPHAGRPRSATCRLDGLPLPPGALASDSFTLTTPDVLADEPRMSFAYDAAEMEALCTGMLQSYYAFYRLPCPDFSQEELAAFAAENWAASWTEGQARSTVPHLSQDGKAVPVELVSGVGVEPYAGSGLEFSYLSYGGLFELLTRLELAPEGGPEWFSVTGADGALYEFSYSFTQTEASRTWWYYTRDGEPAEYCRNIAGGMPILRVGGAEFQAITGLKFQKP